MIQCIHGAWDGGTKSVRYMGIQPMAATHSISRKAGSKLVLMNTLVTTYVGVTSLYQGPYKIDHIKFENIRRFLRTIFENILTITFDNAI